MCFAPEFLHPYGPFLIFRYRTVSRRPPSGASPLVEFGSARMRTSSISSGLRALLKTLRLARTQFRKHALSSLVCMWFEVVCIELLNECAYIHRISQDVILDKIMQRVPNFECAKPNQHPRKQAHGMISFRSPAAGQSATSNRTPNAGAHALIP